MFPNKKKLCRRVADGMAIPKELSGALPLISMVGQEELVIENYKSILEYTDSILLIRTKQGLLKIEGSCLYLSYYTKEELKLTGRITAVRFLKGGAC